MFRQADIELAVLVLHPDVVIRQAVQGGSPDDIQLLVELLADDFRGIVCPSSPANFRPSSKVATVWMSFPSVPSCPFW